MLYGAKFFDEYGGNDKHFASFRFPHFSLARRWRGNVNSLLPAALNESHFVDIF